MDPHGVTIVHSIRVYGKTKEALGVGDDDNDDGYFGGPSYPADGEVLGDQVPGCLASTPSCVPITTASRYVCLDLLMTFWNRHVLFWRVKFTDTCGTSGT